MGRFDYNRVVKCIEATPEVINAYNVTGEHSWLLEIVVTDVGHLDQVLRPFCSLTDTSTAVVLNIARHGAPVTTPAAVQARRNGGG